MTYISRISHYRKETAYSKETRLKILPAVILAIAAFMAILGRARGSTVERRLAGMGIPALAHMAAALALAISNNCSLSEETQERQINTN